ncbi:MAG: NUDIX domain-containing protein [Patescibacteria group bacterium]
MNILRTLLFIPAARFTQLNNQKIGTDQFNFHLKRLLALSLVEKQGARYYSLTIKGKEAANQMDTDTATFEKQAKVAVLIVGVRRQRNRQEFLVQKRLKQPYYGFHGFISGKVRWGEILKEAAAREFKEEAGLSTRLELKGIKHKIDYDQSGLLLEDKYFFVFRANNPSGKLINKFEGGENSWLTREDILRLPQLFDGVDESLKIILGRRLLFSEDKYNVSHY